MAKSKINKNKIFTSAKKIFKTRDELDQEEVLDIEQQDIAQEIEQLRAEIKAFYLEHPDKDPSMPDKIYVKDMNELEEKITEHIPKKVVEDEIVIKNIIEQDGPSGSNPLDFSRMKEYDLPDEFRSQVFSPDIVESDIEPEPDTVVERSAEQSNADTIRDLFGEELYQEIGNSEEEESQNIIVEDEVNNITANLNSINDSLDQELLKQLQELRKEEDPESELKNRVFTHQSSSKSKTIAFGEESEHMEQDEQEKLVEQTDEETQSMSDLLSRLLSEGKLEADLHSEDNQEDNGDIYIPGLDLESTENKDNEEAGEEEGESIEITDPQSEVDLDNGNTEEPGEVHDSNLSDLLSNLLSNNQKSEKDESPEADEEAEDDNTEEYRNRVFISSVKAIKNMPQSEETLGDGKAGEQGNEEAGNKPGETVIFQEYGENEEEQIEINLGGLGGESLEKEDISAPVSIENSIKQEIMPEFEAEEITNQITKGVEESSDDSEMKSDMTQSDISIEDKSIEEITEESTVSKEEESENSDDITENLSPEESREEQVQLDKYHDESKIISGDNADEILKVEMEERKSLSGEKEETDSDSLVNNSFLDDETTDQLGVMEDILNSLLEESQTGIDTETEIEAEAVKEPMDEDISVVTESELNKNNIKALASDSEDPEFELGSSPALEISADEHEEQLKGKSDSSINNIEDILNSLMEDTQAGQSDLRNNEKQSLEKQIIENQSMENLEHIDGGKDSAEKSLEEGISAYFQEDHVPGRNNVIHKKIADPVAVVVPEKKKIVGKVTKEEKIKKPAVNKKPEENITKEVSKEKVSNEKISKEQKQISAEIVKADASSHAVKVLTEEKRQNLLSRLIQKIKELFKKKPKMEIVSQDAVMEESNVYKGQEKETFINGLITGSVSGDNVTLNPLAVVKKDVIAQGKVLCLSGAAIMGKVSCDSIIVEGTVFGEIEARGKVIIKNDALVLGNIYSSDVRITQGAMVQGDIFFKSPERKGK